jgi:hypothetical protein
MALQYTKIVTATTTNIGVGVTFHGVILITGTGNVTVNDGSQVLAPLVAVGSIVNPPVVAENGVKCTGMLNVVTSGTAEILVLWR